MFIEQPNSIMVFATLALLLIILLSFLWLHSHHKNGGRPSSLPQNLPIFGMILSTPLNLHRSADFTAIVPKQSGGTFLITGPWFTKIGLLITADPENVRYVMSRNHHQFNHGANFEQIFEIFGDGIISSGGDLWKYQRKIALSYFTSERFRRIMAETFKHKVEQGLIPLLERFCIDGSEFDLQYVMQRLTGDITFSWLTGLNPDSVSFDTSRNLLRDLAHELEEVIAQRHALPDSIWKLLKWLKVGKEGNLRELEVAADSFMYGIIGKKRDEVMKMRDGSENEIVHGDDLLSVYTAENHGTEGHGFKSHDIFLRDTFFCFLLAGRETLSSGLVWFFWLLVEHPQVHAKIMEELTTEDFNAEYNIFALRDPNKLVYLHAAIYEALRLYPPLPFNHRSPNKPETLPSRHQVKPWTKIILCTYAMGRMKQVWGEDCEDFKPERWITGEGTIKHEPSHKFFSFNTGPRSCIGKEMSVVQMKAIVCATLRHNYRFKLVGGHRVEPASSSVLWMKHGLKVRVTKDVKP